MCICSDLQFPEANLHVELLSLSTPPFIEAVQPKVKEETYIRSTRSTCRTRLKRLEEKAQAGKLLEMERPKIYVREAKPPRGRRGPTPRTGRPTIERKEVRKERRKERKRERRREQEREKQTVSPGPRINQTFRFLEGRVPVEGCRGHRRSRQAPVQASPSLLSSRLCFLCRIIVVGERSRKSESLCVCVRACVCV